MRIHLRFTPAPTGQANLPPIAQYDLSGALSSAVKYIVAKETTDRNGRATAPHYHIWIESDVCEKTMRNHITKSLNVPTLGRGKTNGYYSLQEWTDPAYICKGGQIVGYKGYTPEEITEYINDGKKRFLASLLGAKRELRRDISAAAEGGGKESKDLNELFDEYVEAVLPKDKSQEFDLHALKVASRLWWRKRSRLLPHQATYNRFVWSAWMEWVDITRMKLLVEHNVDKFIREDMISKNSTY